MRGHATISAVLDTGAVGLFYNQRAYFGMEFQIEGKTHYGWALLDCSTLFGQVLGGGEIVSWAYNSVPNQAIIAGAVPEPSTWVFLAVGGATLFLWKRRS
ncbi:MAG: PEP-CTERM sorting domain-containing protein [Verrucomicrobiota bacterium]|nr:PEP-CTERM sorting domain-containing protein [Verrucomicrobiota bacterium]